MLAFVLYLWVVQKKDNIIARTNCTQSWSNEIVLHFLFVKFRYSEKAKIFEKSSTYFVSKLLCCFKRCDRFSEFWGLLTISEFRQKIENYKLFSELIGCKNRQKSDEPGLYQLQASLFTEIHINYSKLDPISA